MFIRNLFVALLFVSSTVLSAKSDNLEPGRGAAPDVPKDPALVQVEDVPGLPRILIIGDSISIGYTLNVRARLQGVANVHRPPANCGPTERGLEFLDRWLGEGKWDVIHFNFGLHDLKYLDEKGAYVAPEKGKQVASPEVYRENLKKIVARLQKTGAKLVFATTTPVPYGTAGRKKGDEAPYNEAALSVMLDQKIAVDDLCGFVLEQQKTVPQRPLSGRQADRKQNTPLRPGEIQLPYNVHFTPEGYERLGGLVAESVQAALKAGK